ncbi:hypothetical protein PENANT_c151G00504 [Penicillium antarcticum]|uniref:Uncharacterized protein n=1 Tax=Penicillium antarcticum TaxID=416450 RepID=A0A1V6PEW7_9EURO|nr:uncharacterized protein N7508_007502 [Penicillium antarcticum]KAJ5300259.1 hypothetical protein N7508_007502 [Penicillium antarcticum]OQD75558.1 hypothetical protein PENANT_c151G00504 [Penicillium antarcticum]
MSPRRPNPAQASQPWTSHDSIKMMPETHLGSLQPFHPDVYQSTSFSHNATRQPTYPLQSQQQVYRPSSGPRDIVWWCEFLDNVTPGPSTPRLDPIRSPGPVTPLALDAVDYEANGSVKHQNAPRKIPQSNN